MLKSIKELLGWSTPVAPCSDPSALAWQIGHTKNVTCLVHRQGRCPPDQNCSDCSWSEDMSRD